jgi:hypothetical protein
MVRIFRRSEAAVVKRPDYIDYITVMRGRFTYKLTWVELVRLYRLTLDQAPRCSALGCYDRGWQSIQKGQLWRMALKTGEIPLAALLEPEADTCGGGKVVAGNIAVGVAAKRCRVKSADVGIPLRQEPSYGPEVDCHARGHVRNERRSIAK